MWDTIWDNIFDPTMWDGCSQSVAAEGESDRTTRARRILKIRQSTPDLE